MPGTGSNSSEGPSTPRGTWSFKDLHGGQRVNRGRPCPICSGETNCQISAEHPDVHGVRGRAVLCRRRTSAETDGRAGARHTVAAPGGVGEPITYQATYMQAGGRVWVPVLRGGDVLHAPIKTDEQRAREAADEAAADEAKRVLAEREYMRACGGNTASDVGVDDPTVVDYLRGRGIDPAWLPGGRVPRCLRFCPDFARFYDFERPSGSKNPLKAVVRAAARGESAELADRTVDEIPEPSRSPAMVAAVFSFHDHPRLIRGVHATFLKRLPDGRVVKDEEIIGGGRREFAPCDGLVIVGGHGSTRDNLFPTGVAMVGEGFETTLSAMVGCDSLHSAIVVAHTTGLKKLPKTLKAMGDLPRSLHTIVPLVDLDKLRNSKGHMARAGQRACWQLAQDLAIEFPWITVKPAMMRAADFPEFVHRVPLQGGSKDLEAVLDGERWCGLEMDASGAWVEEQPIDPAKGVDWNDALRAIAPSARLMLGSAILRGVDLAANADRARALLEQPATSEAVDLSAASPAPPSDAEHDSPGSDAGQATPPGARGGKGAKGGGGGGREKPPRALGGGDDDEQNTVPETDLGRARMFLWQTMAPAEGERSHASYFLTYVDGEFKRWAGNVWKPMRAKGEVTAIRGLVREWLTSKGEWKTSKDGARYFDWLNPALKTVEAVAKCVLDEVRVDTEESRFWMPPAFNGIGEPIVGRKPWERIIHSPETVGLPDPKNLITLNNCVLDTKAWENGELRTLPHQPRLFNEHVLPFDLPVERIHAALNEGDGGGLEGLARSLCPNFHKFVFDAFEGHDHPEQAEEAMRELRKLIWYYCTYSTSCKEANIAIFLGPDNAGKGTLVDTIKAVIGEGNYVSSTVDEAADKNHVTSWQGKRLAIVSEAESGERADLKRAMNFWKRVSGGDGVSVRELYKLEKPDVQLPTRILVSANEMPEMKDRTGAFLSRMICFPFRLSHTGRTTYDPGLKKRVIGEAPGVFVWAMVGGLEVGERKQQGRKVFEQPSSGRGAIAGYRQYQGDLEEFITEWLVFTQDPKDVLLSRDVFDAYVCFRTSDGHPNPRQGGPAGLTKGLLTLLWKYGWRGQYEETIPVDDQTTGTKRRMAGYRQMHLSDLAKMAIAAAEASSQGRAGVDGSIRRTYGNEPDQNKIWPV